MSHSNPSSPAVRSSGHARRPSFNTYFDNAHVPIVVREEEEPARRESPKNLKNDVNYRPKISSHLKTSTTVLEDGYSNDGFDLDESHRDIHESSDSSGDTVIDKDTPGRYGSPGVPGMPVYSHNKLTHSAHLARPAPRRKLAEQNPQHTRSKVDAGTQTLNDASTQTSDGNQIPLMDVLPQIPEDTRSIPIPTVSPSHLRRPQLAMQAGQAHHRRSVSWDPPSIDTKTKSQGMLSMLLKEKREAALQKEAELRRENELRKELEQQRQQILLREAVVSKLAAPPIPTQTIASPPTIAVTSPPTPTSSSSPGMVHSPSLPSSPLAPPQLSQMKATHRVNAHHHRSKSDPNVIPLLMKGLRVSTSPAIVATLNTQRSPKQDSLHLSPTSSSSISPSFSSSYYTPPPRGYPTTHALHRNVSSSKLGTSPVGVSPSPSSSPTRDKQRELLELEMKIELKQKQLMDKGILPPQSPTHHGGSNGDYNGGVSRRRGSHTQWSLENPQDNQIISSLLLEDIEDELEHIRQRTMDIQDKVELLERVRCAAPDPVLMLFGNLRNSRAPPAVPRAAPAPRVSPPYFFSPVVTDNDDVPSFSALRPRMAKKYSSSQQTTATLSPTPRGPDRTKARSLMSPSSAFMAPPPRPGSTDAVGNSEGEY